MKQLLYSSLVVFVICGLLIFSGCAPEPEVQELDWTLYATEISSNGEVLDEFTFTVTGTVPSLQDVYNAQKLILDIVWPDTFRLVNSGPETYNGWASSTHETEYFYFLNTYAQDLSGQNLITGQFGVAPEKGYALFIWDDKESCIVASTDPNTPIKDIVSFFDNMEAVKQFQ